jgi:hypothetical protein
MDLICLARGNKIVRFFWLLDKLKKYRIFVRQILIDLYG